MLNQTKDTDTLLLIENFKEYLQHAPFGMKCVIIQSPQQRLS